MKFQRAEAFQIRRITRGDLNRMQPNEIARSSIYSRGVLAVVGKAEFFRFEESSSVVRTTAAVTENRPSAHEEETQQF